MDAVADGDQGDRRQGRELAIYQAADAFELFAGLKPPVAAIGDAFDAVMASRYGAV